MIRIAICDDMPDQIDMIQRAAETYFAEHKEQAEYTTYDNPFTFLGDVENRENFDIVLLDICMPGILGTDVAAEMRRNNDKAEIIFLTMSDEFAVQAFAVQAAHYLLKPFTQLEFNEAMDRGMMKIVPKHGGKMLFRLVGTGVQVEKISHITYVESKGHILQIHLKNGTSLETRMTLNSFLDMVNKFSPDQFVSPSKGYVINQDAVHVIKSSGVEVQGRSIPLSKRKYSEFKEKYFRYIFMK
jgi:DNA-binding LytR/AlgR family response regulator